MIKYFPCLFVLLALISCAQTPRYLAGENTQTIVSTYGMCRITLPSEWIVLETPDAGMTHALNPIQQHYLSMSTQSIFHAYLHGMTSLKEYSRLRTWYVIDHLEDVRLSRAFQTTISGMDAIQLEVEGISEDVPCAFLITAVEGVQHFHMIIVWAPLDVYRKSIDLFQEITLTFEEL
ncbi:MAG: hypothetical protein ACP5G0_05815 [Desulfomonilia bacterium]